ncbi:MAG: hypothetical protein ACJAYE_003453 [Candidatus Azotimanducaceae bacterium]|jgi:hypothetical protein
MTLLTINLSHSFETELQLSLPAELCKVRNLDQALLEIATKDFSCIVIDVRPLDCASENLAALLAETSLGTKIICLGSERTVPDPDYWQAQGISLLYQIDSARLIELVIEHCATTR